LTIPAARPVVVELGTGTAIPTLRFAGEDLGCPLIRINPFEHIVKSSRDISIPLGTLGGVKRIVQALDNL